jgi:cobalamin biosynthesis protein CobT
MEIENKIWLDDESLGYIEEEHTFDKDKYIDDIYGYQEIIGELRNSVDYTEFDSVYDDINNIQDVIDEWEEEDFIRYIKYLKKLVGEDL